MVCRSKNNGKVKKLNSPYYEQYNIKNIRHFINSLKTYTKIERYDKMLMKLRREKRCMKIYAMI